MNEVKLCECGCGLPAPISKRTDRNRGHVKGQPYRFIKTHGATKPRPAVPTIDDPDARLIALTKGKFAIVDAADYEWLNQYHWVYHNGYAGRAVGPRGDHHFIFLHNVIMQPPDGLQVDHINLDKLDNRRANLRRCTPTQNNGNMGPKRGTSKYKGVSWVKDDEQWLAQIQFEHKQRRLGQFDSEVEAAKVYDAAARKFFGEFARCNFPVEE